MCALVRTSPSFWQHLHMVLLLCLKGGELRGREPQRTRMSILVCLWLYVETCGVCVEVREFGIKVGGWIKSINAKRNR